MPRGRNENWGKGQQARGLDLTASPRGPLPPKTDNTIQKETKQYTNLFFLKETQNKNWGKGQQA